MSVNLKKGQKISLTKGGGGLGRVMVGLGWDEAKPQKRGFFSKPTTTFDIDCDASVFLCGENGKVISERLEEACVYFKNLNYGNGAIVHQGDNLTGAGEGDDEQIMVNLPAIPANVSRLVFVVNIYDANVRNQHFGMIENAFIRLVDMAKNTEICRFDLSENYSGMTGLVVGEIYRHNNEWKFNAIGQAVQEASRLGSLFQRYM